MSYLTNSFFQKVWDKLETVAVGATANDTDANLKNRANHTGTQAIGTVDGLQAALDGKASSSHTHTIANVTGLQSVLDAKLTTPSGTVNQPLNGTGTPQGRTFANPSRSLNASFQISSTRDAYGSYSVDIAVTSALLAGSSGTVVLEYADQSGFTSGVTTVAQSTTSTGGVLNVSNIGTASVTGIIPAGKFARLRTVNNTATPPTFTFRSAQEMVL